MAAKFELYKSSNGEYRWRLRASNGQVIATGGEGYSSKAAAQSGIESVKSGRICPDRRGLARRPSFDPVVLIRSGLGGPQIGSEDLIADSGRRHAARQ